MGVTIVHRLLNLRIVEIAGGSATSAEIDDLAAFSGRHFCLGKQARS
jgi:hypothetical protein